MSSRRCLFCSHCLDWSGGKGRSIRDEDGRLCVPWVLGILSMLWPGEVLSRGWKHMIIEVTYMIFYVTFANL